MLLKKFKKYSKEDHFRIMKTLAKEKKHGEHRSETVDGRPKVHKIVVLGEGGVGKSGR